MIGLLRANCLEHDIYICKVFLMLCSLSLFALIFFCIRILKNKGTIFNFYIVNKVDYTSLRWLSAFFCLNNFQYICYKLVDIFEFDLF